MGRWEFKPFGWIV